MTEIKVIMKRISVTSNSKARRQGVWILKCLSRQLLFAWNMKTVNIMSVDNTRNPPIWQVYCHTRENLGTVLSWWKWKVFLLQSSSETVFHVTKISFFFLGISIDRSVNSSNRAVYTYQEIWSKELLSDYQLLLQFLSFLFFFSLSSEVKKKTKPKP